jgi:hypothetical protein
LRAKRQDTDVVAQGSGSKLLLPWVVKEDLIRSRLHLDSDRQANTLQMNHRTDKGKCHGGTLYTPDRAVKLPL